MSELRMQRRLGQLSCLDVCAKAAELAVLALPPVVDHQFRDDVGQRQLNRVHRSVGDYKGPLLYPFRFQKRRRFIEPGSLDYDVGALDTGFPIFGSNDLLAEILAQALGKTVATFLAARMDPDFLEIKEMIEEPHVPIGRSASADVAEHLRVLARQIFGADRCDRTGPHVRDPTCVQNRPRCTGAGIEQSQDAKFRMKTEFVIVDEVANDLDAGTIDRRLDRPTQHVEMPVGDAGFEMDPWFDDRLASALTGQARFDRRQDLLVGDLELFDVETIEVSDIDRWHAGYSSERICLYIIAGAPGKSMYRVANKLVKRRRQLSSPPCRRQFDNRMLRAPKPNERHVLEQARSPSATYDIANRRSKHSDMESQVTSPPARPCPTARELP